MRQRARTNLTFTVRNLAAKAWPHCVGENRKQTLGQRADDFAFARNKTKCRKSLAKSLWIPIKLQRGLDRRKANFVDP